MLTTSPARSARQRRSRIVRASGRAVSPSREIWPDAGLTHQSPMRSVVVVGRSMDRVAPRFGREKRRSPSIPHRAERPTAFQPSGPQGRSAMPAHASIADAASFQKYSECFRRDFRTSCVSPRYPVSAFRIADKSEVREMGTRNGENMTPKKLFNLFGIGALLFAICAAPSTNGVALNRPAKPFQNRPVTQALPAAGTYKIDPDHSFAYFGARHHVVGLVRGRFDKVTGTFTVSQDAAACSVDVTIDVSSISTQVTERDQDLQSEAYFDVKKFPTMTYQGRGVRRVSENSWTMDGSLTMHGVTKVVPLTFNFSGAFSDIKP